MLQVSHIPFHCLAEENVALFRSFLLFMSFSCSLKWHVWVFINHDFTDDYSSETVLFLDSQNGRTHCSRDPCPKGQCRSTLLIGASTSCCQACPGNQKWTCLNVSFWENVIRDLRMAKGEGDGLYSVSRTNLEGKLELFPCLAFLSKFRRHELILGLCIHSIPPSDLHSESLWKIEAVGFLVPACALEQLLKNLRLRKVGSLNGFNLICLYLPEYVGYSGVFY